MKITYLNYMADLYGYSIGSTIKARRLLGSLLDMGHTVEFYWLSHQRNFKQENKKSEAKATRLRDRLLTPKQLLRNLPQFLREVKILRRNHPDVVIVRLDAFRLSALFATRACCLPMVIEADGASSYEWLTFNQRGLWPKALLWCEKIMLKSAVGVFTQSQVAKDYFVRTHGLSPERITVITNGADPVAPMPEQERRELSEKLGLSAAKLIIGFVGSMHHWHGMQQMAALVGDVLSEFHDAAFLFVGGGGALEAELKSRVQDLQRNRVIFTGTVPFEQVSRYIQLFDIAVAPYAPIEVFYFSPVKIFEYMAAGKAIVAARIGQIAKVLDGETAMLYEPGNIEELRSRIFTLLTDEALRQKLGDNAQRVFFNNHTWKHKAEELDTYLRARIGGP